MINVYHATDSEKVIAINNCLASGKVPWKIYFSPTPVKNPRGRECSWYAHAKAVEAAKAFLSEKYKIRSFLDEVWVKLADGKRIAIDLVAVLRNGKRIAIEVGRHVQPFKLLCLCSLYEEVIYWAYAEIGEGSRTCDYSKTFINNSHP